MTGALPGTGHSSARGTLARSRLFLGAILVVAALVIGVSAVLFQAPALLGNEKALNDFDAFHIAGTMAARGDAAQTYRADTMLAEQHAVTGTDTLMPWTYPPPYTLAMIALAQLPIGVSYVLFIASTFLFYLYILRRIAGDCLPGVLIAILPAVMILLRTGQNGFLIGGLTGAFLLAFQDSRDRAGIPLGLMVIKPHLAAGIALMALLGRRWTAMAIAAAIVVGALVLSTLVFGTAIWPAFFQGVGEASGFLARGVYPLFRMTSVYACASSLGAPPRVAMALHGVVALAGLAAFLLAWHRGCAPRRLAALACIVSLLVSPYNYDYDLTILGLAAAFVLDDLIALARPGELLGLCVLSWIVTGYGLAINSWRASDSHVANLPAAHWSLIAPALIALVVAAYLVLRRGPGDESREPAA